MAKKILTYADLQALAIGEVLQTKHTINFNEVTELYTAVPGGWVRDRLQRGDDDEHGEPSAIQSVTSVFIPNPNKED